MSHLLLSALLTVCAAFGQQKLPDGVLYYWDCDRWTSGGWRDNAWAKGGSGRIDFDVADKFHGAASIRLDGVMDAEVAAYNLETPVLVETGGEYVLQVWTKTRRVAGVAEVRCLAHGPKPGEQYRPLGWVKLSPTGHLRLPADQDWTRHRVTIGDLPGGTNRLFFYFRIEGEGTVWFDEFSVAQAGVEVPPGAKVPLRDEDYAGIRLDDADLPANLFTNGGFEEGMGPWTVVPSDYTALVDDAVAHSGSHSLRYDAREHTSCHIWQRVRIDPRRYYRISLWAKAEGLIGYFFTHLLPFNRHAVPTGWHGENHASEHHYVTGDTGGWQERVLVTRFRPDADAVAIFLRVEDTIGTVWIDDVTIQPLPLDYEAGGEGR